jgi:hypothetical protein
MRGQGMWGGMRAQPGAALGGAPGRRREEAGTGVDELIGTCTRTRTHPPTYNPTRGQCTCARATSRLHGSSDRGQTRA